MHWGVSIIIYALDMIFLFFLIETNKDMVWYPIQQVVPLQWIPNLSDTSNQTYKNLLIERKKKCFS